MRPFKISIDKANDRIKVNSYTAEAIPTLVSYLDQLASEQSIGKVIIVAREEDLPKFLKAEFKQEGLNQGFFRGRSGFFLAKYFKHERTLSNALIIEDNILDQVLQKPVSEEPSVLPEGYSLRDATLKDVTQLSLLFTKVFASYPTPIYEECYLHQLIQKYPVKVIVHRDTIVCVASAETDKQVMAAELTDCACLAEHRSKGLNTIILQALEADLKLRGYQNLYSIARARSAGINTVLRKLGYTFGGRLINNCHICGQFEDMNLWYKTVKD